VELSPDTHTAPDVIRLLDLQPLPHEGGWFRRTAEATDCRPDGRRAWSMIHALFTPGGFSALHRLAVDEIWCWQAGDPLHVLLLEAPRTRVERVILGADFSAGQRLQFAIAAGVWQGATVRPGGRWSLVTCLVVPEFRWEDFALGDRAALTQTFPRAADDIRQLTRAEA
jgi:predicted cupin superfamily sugar epimerase